jgi:hypothetical protein
MPSQPTSVPENIDSADNLYLQQRGWKMLKRKYVGSHYVCLWDHTEHRHPTRGCFTQTEALGYQRKIDKHAKQTNSSR